MVRIQLELPDDRVQELDQLAELLGMTTRKELFNSALTLFEWAVFERTSGRMIASVDEKQGKYKEVIMPSLERLARSGKPQEALVAHSPESEPLS